MRLGILVSGKGSTAAAVIESCRNGKLLGKIEVVVVVVNKDLAGEKVKEIGVEPVAWNGENLLPFLKKYDLDLVAQLGWLVKTPTDVVEYFQGRIFNQHPGSLDPGRKMDFGGKGMYGLRVREATEKYFSLIKKPVSIEATTHFVTPNYDEGDLISVKKSKEGDDFLKIEHDNVIKTLELFWEGKAVGWRRKKPLISKKNAWAWRLVRGV